MINRETLHNASIDGEEDEKTPLQSGHEEHSRTQSSQRHSQLAQGRRPSTKDVAIAPWGICWYKPASVFCLFVIGLGSAIAHHLLYSVKDGTLAKHQQWTIRAGTGLAYLVGFSLATIVGISRDQWLWHTLRTRFLTLKGIDALFSVTSNLFCFFNGDMVLKAKVSTVMAAVKWLFPLLAIFVPSTISVVSRSPTTKAHCTVMSLDFNHGKDMPSVRGDSSYFLHLAHDPLPYTRPSPQANRLFTVPALSGRATPSNDTGPFGPTWEEDCSVNCTYSVQFKGPAVNCTEIDPLLPSAPWSGTYDLPRCEPSSENNTLRRMPVFIAQRWKGSRTSFWVLHTVEGEDHALIACREQRAYTCQASVANYSIEQIISGNQFVEPTITNVKVLYPIEDSRVASNSSFANEANWALFDTLFGMLGGSLVKRFVLNDTEIIKKGKDDVLNVTQIGGTSLVNSKGTFVYPLGPGIEAMVHKMVASLLSDPYLYYTVRVAATCSSTKTQNVYKYNPFTLIAAYSIAIFVSMLMAVLGSIALVRNGVTSDACFSTILRTTRNPTLDRELMGGCLGGAPLPDKLGGLKLKFGELPAYMDDGEPAGYMDYSEVRHTGMGIEGEVSPIRKGGWYS